MAEESPAKKARKVTYMMNINNCMDKAWEGKTLTEVAQAPISALQGLADWTDDEFAKLGLSSIHELGTWKFFLWARSLCKLAETEIRDKREERSRLNVNNAMDYAHEGKHLTDILELPPSALQGLAEWVDPVLAKLKVKTIKQLGTWKFAEWANSIAVLMPLEKELPLPPAPTSSPKRKAAKPKADAEAPGDAASPAAAAAAAPAAVKAEPDPDAVTAANSHGLNDVVVTAHHKLALVDVTKNMDKYFVLQTLKCDDKFLCVSRWGRTGTRGQSKVDGPFDSADEAATIMAEKFKEKSANDIEAVAAGSFEHKGGKYNLVDGDDGATRSVKGANGGCLWQYWVDDGVDGKRDGWYDYFKEAAEEVERAHAEFINNPTRGYSIRSVQSGHFCYQIDFNEMKQTNVAHKNRKQRNIRRNA